jgi:hypothetical protein
MPPEAHPPLGMVKVAVTVCDPVTGWSVKFDDMLWGAPELNAPLDASQT